MSFALWLVWLANRLSFSKMASIMLTKVTYQKERKPLNAEKTEVVLNVFNEKSTQPTHIEKYDKDDVSLDALWKIWKLEMEAQGFQVKKMQARKGKSSCTSSAVFYS